MLARGILSICPADEVSRLRFQVTGDIGNRCAGFVAPARRKHQRDHDPKQDTQKESTEKPTGGRLIFTLPKETRIQMFEHRTTPGIVSPWPSSHRPRRMS
jgi:hypothetical protein